MEFEGQYLTYEEYKGLGGTLDLMPFNLLEFESRKKIDERTLNRLAGVETIPQEVKMCIFKIINSVENYSKKMDSIGNVKSENTDGYSVSYITNSEVSEVIKSKDVELDDIITTYLNGVVVNGKTLIFLGVQ